MRNVRTYFLPFHTVNFGVYSALADSLDTDGVVLSTYYSLLPKEHFEALIESKAALGDVQAQRRLEDAAPDANNASRAYYKVHEAFLREKLSFTRHHAALDVGAAPGGWAFYLSKVNMSWL